MRGIARAPTLEAAAVLEAQRLAGEWCRPRVRGAYVVRSGIALFLCHVQMNETARVVEGSFGAGGMRATID